MKACNFRPRPPLGCSDLRGVGGLFAQSQALQTLVGVVRALATHILDLLVLNTHVLLERRHNRVTRNRHSPDPTFHDPLDRVIIKVHVDVALTERPL